jgi:uncharacterized protein (DUF1330 family)
MAAYIIADVEVLDNERYAGYRQLSSAAFGVHGVDPIVRGGKTTPLEGRAPGRTVVLKFDSVEAAQAFYDSPEYLKARKAREGIAVMNMFIVEGI